MQFRYQSGEQLAEITLERAGDGYQAVVNGQAYAVEILDQQPGMLSLRLDGRPLTFYWGQDGSRKWIAFDGIVYDITDCPKWRTDLHEQLHFPGQDLTSELPDAPHQEDVFSRPCVKLIGRLQPD